MSMWKRKGEGVTNRGASLEVSLWEPVRDRQFPHTVLSPSQPPEPFPIPPFLATNLAEVLTHFSTSVRSKIVYLFV